MGDGERVKCVCVWGGDTEARKPRDRIEVTGPMAKVTEETSHSGYCQVKPMGNLSGHTDRTPGPR